MRRKCWASSSAGNGRSSSSRARCVQRTPEEVGRVGPLSPERAWRPTSAWVNPAALASRLSAWCSGRTPLYRRRTLRGTPLEFTVVGEHRMLQPCHPSGIHAYLRSGRVHAACAEYYMPDQSALIGIADARVEGQLVDLADVMKERGRHQKVPIDSVVAIGGCSTSVALPLRCAR